MFVKIEFGNRPVKARVWINDLPNIELAQADPVLLSTSRVPRTTRLYNQRVVEARSITGKPNYGLVGGTFTPDDSGQFRACIRPNLSVSEQISWSLDGGYDKVRAGLPSEYYPAMSEVLCSPLTSLSLGSGTLELNCFAYSAYSSSNAYFERITLALVKILAAGVTAVDDLKKLLEPKIVLTPSYRPYWIEFVASGSSIIPNLQNGFGATAGDETEALRFLKQYIGFSKDGGEPNIPQIGSYTENIDVTTLDPAKVLPYIGDITKRGVWFPTS